MTAPISQRISHLLTEQMDAAAHLDALLEDEQAALAQLDAQRVEQLTREKQQWIDRIEELDHRRTTLLDTAGYGGGTDAMDAFLHDHDGTGAVAAQWRELLERVRACRDHNRRNGGILEVTRLRVQQALDVLRGQVPGAAGYDPKGKPSGAGGGRTIAKA